MKTLLKKQVVTLSQRKREIREEPNPQRMIEVFISPGLPLLPRPRLPRPDKDRVVLLFFRGDEACFPVLPAILCELWCGQRGENGRLRNRQAVSPGL